MSFPVTLPSRSWGDPRSSRRALLIHGLGSSSALMWRYGVALAEDGWRADAVDLRGHGDAPRTLDYTLEAYAADVALVRGDSDPWDLVVGHSLGGAVATLVAAEDPSWARRLVLIDPAIQLVEEDRANVRTSQEEAYADTSVEAARRNFPHWHELDLELKSAAANQVSRWAVEQTSEQNPDWDVREAALRLTVPTHIIGADPAVFSIFVGRPAEEVVAANPHITLSIVTGAGHSPHRDDPASTLVHLREALAG